MPPRRLWGMCHHYPLCVSCTCRYYPLCVSSLPHVCVTHSLFKILAKKHNKITVKLKELPSAPAENQDFVSVTTPLATPFSYPSPQATDLLIVEEVLRMVLEVVNCCLTHNLHNNPHLVYSLLYQRELFDPFRSHPSLVDILHNIDTVSC